MLLNAFLLSFSPIRGIFSSPPELPTAAAVAAAAEQHNRKQRKKKEEKKKTFKGNQRISGFMFLHQHFSSIRAKQGLRAQ